MLERLHHSHRGNCDERGTAEYNLALGERRAPEAKQYLSELGITEKRISAINDGKEQKRSFQYQHDKVDDMPGSSP